jgi:hypothetical protein
MDFRYAVPLSEADCTDILLGCCSNEWQSSARLVGTVMQVAEERHRVSVGDLALEELLRYLGSIDSFEIDAATLPYGRYRVRLPQR